MNLNTSSLTKAVGLGIAVGVVFGLLGLVPILGIVFGCLGIFVPVAVGALYVYFTKQDGEMLENGPAATGGAVSAAIAGLIYGIVNLIIALVAGTATGAFSQFGDLGLGAEETAIVAGVGGVVGLCIGIVLAAALGAIGAVIYVAISGRQSAA